MLFPEFSISPSGSYISDELTREQVTYWFRNRRRKCGILSRKYTKFSKRAKSVLSHVFAKNSGYVCGEELDELEETLELTRKQISSWFDRERCRRRQLSEGPIRKKWVRTPL